MEGELYDLEQAEREAQAARGTPSTRSRGGGFFGYDSVADMRDGGGKGAHGARFEGGGRLSDFANMFGTPRKARGADTGQIRPVARPSVDYINAARDRINAPYSLGRDLFDGGGLGRRATLEEINAGRGFRGGLLSNLANMFGVRPMGSNDLSLVASYDRARASRPDIVQQMGRNTGVGDGILVDPVQGAVVYPADPVDLVARAHDAHDPRGRDQRNTPPSASPAYDPTEGLNSGFNVTVPILTDILPASTANREVGKQQLPPMTSNRTIDRSPAQEFSSQLESQVGLSKAIEILSSEYGSQVYKEFIENGNQLPSQFSQRELNIGVYGDPFGRGSMVGR